MPEKAPGGGTDGLGSVTPLHAAAAEKVLHVAFSAPETGFDPAKISDIYSSAVIEHIYDPLLTLTTCPAR